MTKRVFVIIVTLGCLTLASKSAQAQDVVPPAAPKNLSLSPSTAPVIQPGSGFTGPIPQPAPIGTGSGVDAKAIARWDVVPYRTFEAEFEIGVIAFHKNGIDRVEFSANGGPWTAVRVMTLNPRTGAKEYWAKLRATDFSDGLIEVRAIAYPKRGIPRVLQGPIDGSMSYQNGNHAMFVNANSGDTLQKPVAFVSPTGSNTTGDGTESNPFATPSGALRAVSSANGSADGATIFLKPGNYNWGPPGWPRAVTKDRWATLRPAPGTTRAEVVFTSSSVGGFSTSLISANNVSFRGEDLLRGPGYLWVDNCVMVGPGSGKFFSWAWWTGTYFTSTEVSNNRNGIRRATFTRNVHVPTNFGSPFGGSYMVVNSSIGKFTNIGAHGDVFHWFFREDTRENIIVYGVTALDFNVQGIFAEVFLGATKLDNVAIVDTSISKGTLASAAGSWWERDTNHLLLWNVQMPDQVFRWPQATYGTTLRNVSILDSTFLAFTHTPLPDDTIVRNTVFVDPGAFSKSFVPTQTP